MDSQASKPYPHPRLCGAGICPRVPLQQRRLYGRHHPPNLKKSQSWFLVCTKLSLGYRHSSELRHKHATHASPWACTVAVTGERDSAGCRFFCDRLHSLLPGAERQGRTGGGGEIQRGSCPPPLLRPIPTSSLCLLSPCFRLSITAFVLLSFLPPPWLASCLPPLPLPTPPPCIGLGISTSPSSTPATRQRVKDKIKAAQAAMGSRFFVSVGGGGRSDHFRAVAKSASLRTKFAAAIGKFVTDVILLLAPLPCVVSILFHTCTRPCGWDASWGVQGSSQRECACMCVHMWYVYVYVCVCMHVCSPICLADDSRS